MLFKTITVLALVATVAHGAAIEDDTEDKAETRRLDLLSPLVSIITLTDNECDTETGKPEKGICYSEEECKNRYDGKPNGKCAKDYGVCCVLTGDVTIRNSGEYFENFKHPRSHTATGKVTATLEPPTETTQIFLEFEKLNLRCKGDDRDDSFVVVGANPGTEIPTLCGNNRDQHMYIDIDNSEGPYKLIVTTSDDDEFLRTWKIKVTYYNNESEDKAPPRCLQYHSEAKGKISSFNYADSSPMMLENLNYPICFGYVSGYCDVDLKFSKFDLGETDVDGNCGNDFVLIGDVKGCGQDLTDLSATVKASAGPISIRVMTDDIDVGSDKGFTGSYSMKKCA